MAPVAGVGYLILEDILEDASYTMIQPFVNVTAPGSIAIGSQTVAVWDASMYVGAQLVVGAVGAADIEVVTITAVNPGSSFTAVFANSHLANEPIRGATFPVRQPTDPLFTQAEMIGYASTAFNDFLVDVPLVYNVVPTITVNPTQQNTALPADSMFPVRVAYKDIPGPYPLRETSQSNLDSMRFNWAQDNPAVPRAYFRDKIPFQNIGIWPKAGNTTNLEVVYAARGPQTMGLADGFSLPDPFLQYVLFKTLSFAFSKDGESKNPALAKYFASRYSFGVKISKMILDAINDPELDIAQ